MSEQASKRAEEFLTEMGVRVRTNDSVKSYNSLNASLESGVIINTSNLIWTAGVKAATIAGLDSDLTERGSKLIVDQYNTVMGYEHIFAIGDIAGFVGENGRMLPMVAPVALQQGRHVAQQIKKIAMGQDLKPFKYLDKGSMATIGRHKAIVEVKNLRMTGIPAWYAWLWLHLFYLLGGRNKIGTMADWTYNYLTFDRGNRHIMDSQ
jgi:NADH dehydrogenase